MHNPFGASTNIDITSQVEVKKGKPASDYESPTKKDNRKIDMVTILLEGIQPLQKAKEGLSKILDKLVDQEIVEKCKMWINAINDIEIDMMHNSMSNIRPAEKAPATQPLTAETDKQIKALADKIAGREPIE